MAEAENREELSSPNPGQDIAVDGLLRELVRGGGGDDEKFIASVMSRVLPSLRVRSADGRRARISRRDSASRARRAAGPKYGIFVTAAAAALLVAVAAPYLLHPAIPEHLKAVVIEASGQTTAHVGQNVGPNDSLRSSSDGTFTLRYEDGTSIAVSEDSRIRLGRDGDAKTVILAAGRIEADVAEQKRGAMLVQTPRASLEVLGTKLMVLARENSTRLEVTEGKVEMTRKEDMASVTVTAGHYAIATSGVELAASPLVSEVSIDLASGKHDGGDGAWRVEGQRIIQSKVSQRGGDDRISPTSTFSFNARVDQDADIRVTLDLKEVTPDTRLGYGSFGFGLVIRLREDKAIVLRTLQNSSLPPGLELTGGKRAPYVHGRQGKFHLRLRLARGEGSNVKLQGKVWEALDEPVGWMVEDTIANAWPIVRIGVLTTRCSCEFANLTVRRVDGR